MALIKFSNLVNDIRGSSGGTTFSRNKGGAYVRNRTKPINPSTPAQGAARAMLGGFSTAWRSLSDANRTSWIENASLYPYINKLGEERVYTGQQLFVKNNMNLAVAEQSPITALQPPLETATVSVVSVVATDADSLQVKIDVGGDSSDTQFVISATGQMSVGTTAPKRSKFRNIAVSDGAGIVNTDLDVLAAWNAVFGTDPLIVGKQIFVRVYGVNVVTGQATAANFGSAVITAI